MEFELEHLDDILQQISENLTKQINIYLFGGAVMVYNRLKPATKDIDILFENQDEYSTFLQAAKNSGFITKNIPFEYRQFDMILMLHHPETRWRLDLFLRKVCNKFCFNPDVKQRSKLFKNMDPLRVYFISFEDIFLMKSLTQRERDLDDMNIILGVGLNFNEINKEIGNQHEHRWDIMERLQEFEFTSGTTIPLPSKLRKQHQKQNEEKNNNLLRKQVKSMKDEGKSKGDIMKHFELSEDEWNTFM